MFIPLSFTVVVLRISTLLTRRLYLLVTFCVYCNTGRNYDSVCKLSMGLFLKPETTVCTLMQVL